MTYKNLRNVIAVSCLILLDKTIKTYYKIGWGYLLANRKKSGFVKDQFIGFSFLRQKKTQN